MGNSQEDANAYFYTEIEAIKASGGGGSGGGTGGPADWSTITNKPQQIKNLAGENASTTSLVSGGSY